MASRDDVVVATKVHGAMGHSPNKRGLSRKHIIEACENSLRRLNVDYVDLYQIHRWDSKTPIEETLDALDSLVRSGKVRYLGASSMAAWQLSKALYTAKENGWRRFVTMQNHYNLVYREEEREMIPLCIDQGVAHHSLESAGAWIPDRARARATAVQLSARKWTRSPRTCTTATTISRLPMWSPNVAKRTRRLARSGRLRVGSASARRNRADHRGHQAATPQGPDRGHRPRTYTGGSDSARKAVPAASRAGTRAAQGERHAAVKASPAAIRFRSGSRCRGWSE